MHLESYEAPTIRRPFVLSFDAPDLPEALGIATPESLDALPFGVIALAAGGRVTAYNFAEQRLAGLRAADVLGRNFFTEIAVGADGSLVRERFLSAWQRGTPLDDRVPFTFNLETGAVRVTLRLVVRGARGWIVVDRA